MVTIHGHFEQMQRSLSTEASYELNQSCTLKKLLYAIVIKREVIAILSSAIYQYRIRILIFS